MKHIKLFESWSLKDKQQNLYVVKNGEHTLRSEGGMTSNRSENNNVLEFSTGDILYVDITSGSLGDRYEIQKVEVKGDEINFLGDKVTIWRMEYSRPDWFKSLERYK